MSEPNIYEYQDHRSFLNRIRNGHPARRRPLSFSRWSRKLGYKSPRSIAMVLKGSRLPSPQMLTVISSDLGLDASETRYLELLVERERRARAGKSTQTVDKELRKLKPGSNENRITMSCEMLHYLSNWFHLVIKQLVGAPDFREDPCWIQRKLRSKLSQLEIRHSLDTLIRLGILVREPRTGRLRVFEDRSLFGPIDFPSSAIRSHHAQMMRRGIEALNEQAVEKREFVTLTFRMDAGQIAKAKETIRKFRDQFEREFFTESSPSVCQLNIQFFEHTQNTASKP